MIDLDVISLENVHFMVDSPWKKLYAEDEEVWGEGILLPNSSGGLKLGV